MAYEYYEQFPGALPAGGTTLTSATELAYLTSFPTEVPEAGQAVVIRGYLNITAGGAGTGFTVKCRRGTGVAGTQVGNTQTVTTANSVTTSVPFSFADTGNPVDSAAAQGVYTITVTAAGANATAVDGSLSIVVPDIGGAVS